MAYRPYDYENKATMRAVLPSDHVMNGKRHDGETVNTMVAVAVRKGKICYPVKVRFSMGRSARASVVYCSIWTYNEKTGLTANGHGSAGGYGYDKQSAALDDAIKNAGIELSQTISGVGESAMRRAVEAIARAHGFRKIDVATFG